MLMTVPQPNSSGGGSGDGSDGTKVRMRSSFDGNSGNDSGSGGRGGCGGTAAADAGGAAGGRGPRPSASGGAAGGGGSYCDAPSESSDVEDNSSMACQHSGAQASSRCRSSRGGAPHAETRLLCCPGNRLLSLPLPAGACAHAAAAPRPARPQVVPDCGFLPSGPFGMIMPPMGMPAGCLPDGSAFAGFPPMPAPSAFYGADSPAAQSEPGPPAAASASAPASPACCPFLSLPVSPAAAAGGSRRALRALRRNAYANPARTPPPLQPRAWRARGAWSGTARRRRGAALERRSATRRARSMLTSARASRWGQRSLLHPARSTGPPLASCCLSLVCVWQTSSLPLPRLKSVRMPRCPSGAAGPLCQGG